MAFSLYKAGPSSTPPTVKMVANGAVAAGDVVKLSAAVSASGSPRVATITGGAGGTDYSYGIAINTAADGGDVYVIPHRSGQVWVADAAANCNNTKVGLMTTYLAATTLAVTTDGTITNNGNRVIIVGMLGNASDKKYLVVFNPATCISL